MLTCGTCGASIERKAGPGRNPRYCGQGCRPRTPRRGVCTGCGDRVYVSSTSAKEPYCRACRADGRAPSRTRAKHGDETMYSKQGCRCRVCREGQARRMREYAARRKAEGRPIDYRRRGEPRNCEVCGEVFAPRLDHSGAFCSARCANVARNLARGFTPRPPRKSRRRRQAETILAKAAAGTTGGSRVWVQGACLVCDAQFLSPGLASRYCSRECRAVARSSRSWISYEDRRSIYVRDAWTCQICREPTSRRYSASDPWSPTLDHVVPRSRGGSDDPTNLRLSHLWCNSVRGDLSHYTDADLQEVA